jgi:hypothetical protein
MPQVGEFDEASVPKYFVNKLTEYDEYVKPDTEVLTRQNKIKLYFSKPTTFSTADYYFSKCIGCL